MEGVAAPCWVGGVRGMVVGRMEVGTGVDDRVVDFWVRNVSRVVRWVVRGVGGEDCLVVVVKVARAFRRTKWMLVFSISAWVSSVSGRGRSRSR